MQKGWPTITRQRRGGKEGGGGDQRVPRGQKKKAFGRWSFGANRRKSDEQDQKRRLSKQRKKQKEEPENGRLREGSRRNRGGKGVMHRPGYAEKKERSR